jgi:hypothetical protein
MVAASEIRCVNSLPLLSNRPSFKKMSCSWREKKQDENEFVLENRSEYIIMWRKECYFVYEFVDSITCISSYLVIFFKNLFHS